MTRMFEMRSRLRAKAAPSPLCPPPTMTTSSTPGRGTIQSGMPQLRQARVVRDARAVRGQGHAASSSRSRTISPTCSIAVRISVVAVVAQPAFHRREDARLVRQPHADDEGEAELVAIGRVERLEALELRQRQPVEPGAGLLGGGGLGQRRVDRGIARQLGVGADQRELLVGRRVAHHLHQPGMEVRQRQPLRGALDHPGAVLEQRAIAGDEGQAVEAHDVAPSIETCADTTFQPSAKRTHAWLCRPRRSLPSRKEFGVGGGEVAA